MLSKSGPHSPCPVCGRDTDGDCRFKDDLILCHQGTSFQPPQMRLGEVLEIDGELWALVSTKAGFDGAAYAFRPDKNAGYPANYDRQPQRGLNADKAREAFAAIDEALSLDEFGFATLPELNENWERVRRANELSLALKQALLKLWRNEPDVGRKETLRRQVFLLLDARKAIQYQRRDLNHFRDQHLCEDLP